MSEPTLFDQIGGDRLRTVLTDFYDRIFADVMIGYLFAGKDRAHLIEREWELTARMLGAAGVKYTGRSMREAHGRHQILGGHFDRRLQLLRNAMAAADVPAAVQDAIVGHTQALRAQVTADQGSECDHDAAAARTEPPPPERPLTLGRRRS